MPRPAVVSAPFRLVHLWIAGLVVAADQVTKAIVRGRFELHDSVEVVPGIFSLTRVHNTGAAFGMFGDVDIAYKAVALTIVAIAAVVLLTMYAATLEPGQAITRLGLAFVIGGAAGNLIDRVSTGYVLDFFDLSWRGWHFWAFNVADASITVGVSLMILDLLKGVAAPRAAAATAASPDPDGGAPDREPNPDPELRAGNRDA